jgi:hypothetical protein
MRDEDLAPFAVADGLLPHVPDRDGGLTDAERQYLCDRARENLATGTGETLENAGRALLDGANAGEVEVRAGREFATVIAWGRLLVVYARAELRGICHPSAN